MKISIINESSPFLKAVIALGDQNSATLGFLPEQAFYDYANKNRIIIASNNDRLFGYLLFRISKGMTYIVHLCVSDNLRGTGVAKALVDRLKQETTYTYGIKLRCRRDYGLDSFWKRLGFTPMSEMPGRSKKAPTTLTVWSQPHQHDTLFDYAAASIRERTFMAVLDTNVVIDLYDSSSNESKQLSADYLKDMVTYHVAEPIFHEINTQPNKELRAATREFAKQFDIINHANVPQYNTTIATIRQKFDGRISDNTELDIAHITHAITAGALAFVTRDEGWLNTKISEFIENEYGLRIVSPGEFILSVDELSKHEEYVPLRLLGLNLQYAKMSSSDLKNVGHEFLLTEQNERIGELHQKLRLIMSNPRKNSILMVKSENVIIAIVAYSLHEKVLCVEMFRISSGYLSPSFRPTLLTRLTMMLLEIASDNHVELISIDNQIIASKEAENAFIKSGFSKNETGFSKILINDILSRLDFVERLSDIDKVHGLDNPPWLDSVKNAVQLIPHDTVYLEKYCWPLKLKYLAIPTYIIPIKPAYAIELFDENLFNDNPSFFANERMEPALSIENVYFKSSKLTPPDGFARILWYVSHDKKLLYDSSIRACSYLDKVDIDRATKLFKRYRRLGVLDWDHILALARNNPQEHIACYQFSFTELFQHPIPYADLQTWYKERFGKSLVVQSYTEIENSDFIELYKWGKHGIKTPINHELQEVL